MRSLTPAAWWPRDRGQHDPGILPAYRSLSHSPAARSKNCQTYVPASLRLHPGQQVAVTARIRVPTEPPKKPLRWPAFTQHPGPPVRERVSGVNDARSVCGPKEPRSPPFGGKQEFPRYGTSVDRVILVASIEPLVACGGSRQGVPFWGGAGWNAYAAARRLSAGIGSRALQPFVGGSGAAGCSSHDLDCVRAVDWNLFERAGLTDVRS